MVGKRQNQIALYCDCLAIVEPGTVKVLNEPWPRQCNVGQTYNA